MLWCVIANTIINQVRLGGAINYVSTFEGGGVSGMLTFADMGEGGIWNADVSIFILKNNEKLRPTTASDVQFDEILL